MCDTFGVFLIRKNGVFILTKNAQDTLFVYSRIECCMHAVMKNMYECMYFIMHLNSIQREHQPTEYTEYSEPSCGERKRKKQIVIVKTNISSRNVRTNDPCSNSLFYLRTEKIKTFERIHPKKNIIKQYSLCVLLGYFIFIRIHIRRLCRPVLMPLPLLLHTSLFVTWFYHTNILFSKLVKFSMPLTVNSSSSNNRNSHSTAQHREIE